MIKKVILSFIRPTLEQEAVVWDLRLKKERNKHIEMNKEGTESSDKMSNESKTS